ncbi:hypothetical protein D3C73_1282850 [compost metagenome]
MKKNRRLIDQASPAAHFVTDLWVQVVADASPGLGHQLLTCFTVFEARRHIDERLCVEAVVPDFQRAHRRQFAHAFPVGANAFHSQTPGIFIDEAVIAGGYGKTGCQTLYIPLPRGG